jgi:Ca2+-binding RTX toxin-like protein
MTLNVMTFGVTGVDANTLQSGNQSLDGSADLNELTAENLISANGLKFQQLLLFLGEANDGDLNIDSGETAFNLSDMSNSGSVVSLGVTNSNDPIRITAHGLVDNYTLGDLTTAVRYDNLLGFGLDSGLDGEPAAHWLNGGDSLTFEVTSINEIEQALAGVSFVVNVNGGGSENVVIDFDGNTVAQAGAEQVVDGINLGLVANGTVVSLDFQSRTITVGTTSRAMTGAEYLSFVSHGLDQLTIGSLNTSTQGFSIKNLTIAATEAANFGTVIQAPPTGGGTTGTAGDDIIIGSTVADTMDAGDGDDEILAGGGNDAINAGGGNDVAEGGDGDDVVNGGDGDDQIIGGVGDDTLVGGAGADNFVFRSLEDLSANTDHIIDFEPGLDTVDLSLISGLSFIGQAAFTGVAGQVRFEVGGGQTHIQVDADGDTVFDDRIIIDNGQFDLTETTAGSLILQWVPILGDASDNLLNGFNQFDDHMFGLAGNDMLIGGDRNDTLEGGDGDDTIDGGAGIDTASYAGAAGGVRVNLGIQGVGQDTSVAGFDTLTSIENLQGSAFDDFLRGDGNDNVLSGLGGQDRLFGGLGNDTLDGGAGEDIVDFSGASSSITVDLNFQGVAQDTGEGLDTLVGIERVVGGSFDDTLIGSAAADVLDGGAGNDTIRGGAGTDLILGSNGNDFVYGEDGDDVFFANPGNDYIDGGAGSDRVSYFSGLAAAGVTVNLNIQGVAQNTGAGGVDTLIGIESVTGTRFNDTLIGTAGSNRLIGAGGNDTISGGSGTDQFVFNAQSASETGTTLVDANVADGEQLEFSSNFGPLVPLKLADGTTLDDGDTIQLGTFVGGGVASVIRTASYGISFDWNGDGVGDLTVDFTNAAVGLVYSAASQSFVLQAASVNEITGTENDDVLVGTAGHDSISGLGGNDIIQTGQGGVDVLDGGIGIDAVSFAAAAGSVTVNLALLSSQNTGQGIVTLAQIENVDGSNFNDSLTGDGNDNVLSGLGGADGLNGEFGNDTLMGGDGLDSLTGGRGNDVLDGGAGSDNVRYNDLPIAVNAPGVVVMIVNGSGTATWNGETDTLISIAGVIGTVGNDQITFDAQDNYFFDVLGADTISGGAGYDYLSYRYLAGGTPNQLGLNLLNMNINLATGSALASGFGTTDTFTSIEAVTGGQGNDTIAGNGNDNQLNGWGGNDTLTGGTSASGARFIDGVGDAVGDTIAFGLASSSIDDGNLSVVADMATGTATDSFGGHDTFSGFENLMGSKNGDQLFGDANDNIMIGQAGNDLIDGRGGQDMASYDISPSASGVVVDLATGIASDGFGGTDTLISIERVLGSNFADTILGNSDDNLLIGGMGNDTIDGRGGVDTASFYHNPNAAVFGNNEDFNVYDVNVNLLTGQAVHGSGEVDTLAGIENVIGGLGNDTITGDSNDNALMGHGGNDVLTGGAGTDRFIWTTADGMIDGLGTDIVDAVTGEVLDFNALLLQTLKLADGSTLDDGDDILAGILLGGGQASLALVSPDNLAFDWNGDGVVDLAIQFAAAPALLTFDASNGDFLIG